MKNRSPKIETYVHGNAVASTALTTLKGLIEGVTCDSVLNDLERTKILDWVDKFAFLKSHKAVGSVFDYLAEALADGVLTIEESNDIKWMIDRNLVSYYDETTQQIQTLLGIMSGIASDNEISSVELAYLWKWLNDNEHLNGIFPFNEIYSIVCQVGTRKTLSTEQKNYLLKLFNWTDDKTLTTENPFVPWTIDPSIEFQNKSFCFTGISKKMSRPKISELITSKNGILKGISGKLDYLIVCTEANIAWTHSCYGRKIEEAIHLRRNGAKILIIAEKDFWDALVE